MRKNRKFSKNIFENHKKVVTQMFRVLSFSLTLCDQEEKDSLLSAIEYNFYMPLFCGPWCIYPIYRKDRMQLGSNEERWSFKKLVQKLFSIFQMYLFIEFYLHIFPFTCVAHDNHTRRNLSLTALAGVVLAAVQHFSNKYTVLYGIPASLSTSIGFYCPPGPHNVSTRSTFRDMWQLFDKGLHLFLKHFIYIPTLKSKPAIFNSDFPKKILASILCYFAVYYWHGKNTFKVPPSLSTRIYGSWAKYSSSGAEDGALIMVLFDNK